MLLNVLLKKPLDIFSWSITGSSQNLEESTEKLKGSSQDLKETLDLETEKSFPHNQHSSAS